MVHKIQDTEKLYWLQLDQDWKETITQTVYTGNLQVSHLQEQSKLSEGDN